MSILTQCDRCLATKRHDAPSWAWVRFGTHVAGRYDENLQAREDRDLCDSCYRELRRWLREEGAS